MPHCEDTMKLRALIFSDDEYIRTLFTVILEESGYEVYKFSTAHICPFGSRKTCPCPPVYTCADILIIDVYMWDISKLEIIAHQRSRGCKVENIAVISSRWSRSQMDYAKELDCKIFQRPLAVHELRMWLDRCEENIDSKRRLWDFLIQDGFCGNP